MREKPGPQVGVALLGIIILVVIILIAVGGLLYFKSSSTTKTPYKQPSPSSRSSDPATIPTTPSQRQDNTVVFKSLPEALKSGSSLKCEYTTPDAKHTSYVKEGKAARTDTENDVHTGTIFKNNTIWIWHKDSKEGVKYTYSKEQFDQFLQLPSDTEEPLILNCISFSVEDSLFVPPADIEFSDSN